MRTEEARLIAGFLLRTIEGEIPITKAVFAALPADKLDYQPNPVAKTALGLLRHITLFDEWFLNAVADGEFGSLPDDSDACGVMTPEDAISRYTERIPVAIERVRALSGEALLREIDLLGLIRMPAVDFIGLEARHSAHHRGQLSTYLRAVDAKVPSIYGPSADTWPLVSGAATS